MSGCPQEADRWSCHGSGAVTWAGLFVASPLCLFFLSAFHNFWNPDIRCVYISLSHRCCVSLHFWVICKASDKSEITPVSQCDSLHASWPWIVCLFIYLGYEPLLDITIANFSPFRTSFLILLTVPHGEAFEFDILTLVHFSFHFFCFRNYTQPSLPRLMYRNTVTLPF